MLVALEATRRAGISMLTLVGDITLWFCIVTQQLCCVCLIAEIESKADELCGSVKCHSSAK